VATAAGFRSRITVRKDGRSADGKSILSLMMLAAKAGCEMTIEAEGEDEKEAVAALAALIEGIHAPEH
jgi:phosphotransferase system HPr (HPr) family protein